MGARGPKPGTVKKPAGSGRQKGTLNAVSLEIKSIAQKHGGEAIEEAVRIMKNSESDQARIAAIRELLDRGYGKASQAVTVDPGDTLSEMMRELMSSVNGQTRGLLEDKPPANGSGVAARQSVLHSGRSRADH